MGGRVPSEANHDRESIACVRRLAAALISQVGWFKYFIELISLYQVRRHQDHQLVKVDACYLVLRRIAANDNGKDPLFGHRLIQKYTPQ